MYTNLCIRLYGWLFWLSKKVGWLIGELVYLPSDIRHRIWLRRFDKRWKSYYSPDIGSRP
jgi:hypothetical protein